MTSSTLASWVVRAACAGSNPAVFFPEPEDAAAIDQAKAVCAACPVREECRTYGLAHFAEVGIWGGLTEAERASAGARRPEDGPNGR